MIQSNVLRVNKFARLVSFLLPGCFILTACTGQTVQVLPASPTTTQLVQSAVPTAAAPTQGVVVTPTVTYIPSPSFTKSIPATATPIPPPTQTPRPTLTEDQAWKEIDAQLHAPNPCRFPCWWDLQPGKTSFEDTLEFFRYLGYEQLLQEYSYQTHKSFVLRVPRGIAEDKFYFHIATRMYDRVLGNIEIWASQGEHEEADMFYQYMEPYSIEHVIAMYGKPDRVLIHPPSYYGENPIRGDGFGGNTFFDIALFYDAIGLLVSYNGEPAMFIGGGKRAVICPQLKDKQVDELFINLRAPDDTIPLARFAPRYAVYIRRNQEYHFPLEEVSPLTLDEFVTVVTKPKQACFSVLVK